MFIPNATGSGVLLGRTRLDSRAGLASGDGLEVPRCSVPKIEPASGLGRLTGPGPCEDPIRLLADQGPAVTRFCRRAIAANRGGSASLRLHYV